MNEWQFFEEMDREDMLLAVPGIIPGRPRFGYPSTEPCWVCGRHNNNQAEPRFLYVVCEDHQNVPPTEINRRFRPE